MRSLLTTAATALTVGFLGFASPVMADQNNGYQGGNGQYQGQYNGNGSGGSNYSGANQGGGQGNYGSGGYGQGRDSNDDGYRGNGRHRDDRFDFGRHDRNSDGWERGWGRHGYDNDRHGRPLSYGRLIRRLEQQGFYGVRGLRMSRYGGGLRAFAFTYRGRPVMLRINPYSGRVLDQRYV